MTARHATPRASTPTDTAATGARIYNLFPLLAGPIECWADHLARIADMGFDWLYLNPFHYPGFSGSLYAVKDPARLHPVVQGDSDQPADVLVGRFVERAAAAGLSVMIDLVAVGVAKDALLVAAHPAWFVRDESGELESPSLGDPSDPRTHTVWGDLARIDYGQRRHRRAQLAYWAGYVRRFASLGVRGFRCDAAYQLPAEVWQALIAEARADFDHLLFAAETLGCTPEEAEALAPCGFAYLFNSAKWWDFRGDWLLDQYESQRRIAPTIAFPESHDTPRLRAGLAGLSVPEVERWYRLRYAFAAAFSTGVLMPMGYEFGFDQRLDVVRTRPGDWDWQRGQAPFDLSAWIAEVNALKAATPALNVEGGQWRVSAPDADGVALLRADRADRRRAGQVVACVINPRMTGRWSLDAGPLVQAAGGAIGGFDDVTPGGAGGEVGPGAVLSLAPIELRLLRGRAAPVAAHAPSERDSRRRLDELAARRLAIESVTPQIDGGRHPVKRCIGDVLVVEADILCDGHDQLGARVLYRRGGERRRREAPMARLDNDRWRARAPLAAIGRYSFTIEAWRDLFASWRVEVAKKVDAGQSVVLELTEGQALVETAAGAARGADADALRQALARLADAKGSDGARLGVLMSEELHAPMARCGERTNLTRSERELEVVVDRPTARLSAWYEMFPRSQAGDGKRHGTFDDVIARLPYVRDMGFDVLYLTPIHPIGATNRKGRNNSLVAAKSDPGSPYAIGAADGGHDAIHGELGSLDDFRRLVAAAGEHGLEIALDFAIQCSPDHPWLKAHPEWFDWRPDGTIKYAENPPKTYEDIVNAHFYRQALPGIWYALREVVLFWVGQGVRIFRVDNPHTKPLPFWEWLIREVQDRDPQVIFLSEAFTRPKMMMRLAKIGFTQSYTYFTWRTHKQELVDYLTELAQGDASECLRPNFFTNTPDINPPVLHGGKRGAFMMRATLAATLSGSWGIYSGFELCEGTPIPGREEYLNSEKYELKAWDWERAGNIRDYIARLNRIRRDNPALHDHTNVRFVNAWNDNVLAYVKMTAAKDNAVLVAVNLDPHAPQGAHFEVPLWEFGLPDAASIDVVDLLSGHRFAWHGKVQHVSLDPATAPCALWRLVPPGSASE